MYFYSVLALAAFIISLIGTRLTILTLRRRTVPLSVAALRGKESLPVPSGGGIAVLFALCICLMVADIPYTIVLALFLLAAISLFDSLIAVPLAVRLVVQGIAIVAALSAIDILPFSGLLPLWLDRIITGLLWLGFTNLFKVMDGVDGIVPAEMISIGAGLCLLIAFAGIFPSPLFTYSLIITAAGCGFLWWNWHPAKIHLGDVGRLPVGFLLGYVLLLTIREGYGFAAIMLPAYYLADGIITCLRRLYGSEPLFAVHRDHYFQKALAHGRSPEMVVRCILGINMLLIFLAIRSVIDPDIAIFHLSLAYLTVFMLLGFFAHERPH